MLLGNTFVSYALRDKYDFDESTRQFIYTVLIAVSVFGTLLFLFLRSPMRPDGTVNERVETISSIQEIKNIVSLFLTKEMCLLNVTFFFTGWYKNCFQIYIISCFYLFLDNCTGLHMSFYAGVYSSSIGFTRRMGSNSKQLVGLSGILIGVGEVLGYKTLNY